MLIRESKDYNSCPNTFENNYSSSNRANSGIDYEAGGLNFLTSFILFGVCMLFRRVSTGKTEAVGKFKYCIKKLYIIKYILQNKILIATEKDHALASEFTVIAYGIPSDWTEQQVGTCF